MEPVSLGAGLQLPLSLLPQLLPHPEGGGVMTATPADKFSAEDSGKKLAVVAVAAGACWALMLGTTTCK